MVTKTVAAHELRPGWVVLPENAQPRRIALARCQGAPPRVIVHWTGTDSRTVYPARARHHRGQPMTTAIQP